MKTALVTGSAGLVGRHLVRELKHRNFWVTQIDLQQNESDRFYHNPCDARKFFASNDNRYDVVFHCAAIVGGRQTIEHEPMAVAVNLELDAAYFNWALRTRPHKTVYFSSSAVYPVSMQMSIGDRQLKEFDVDLDDVHTPDASYGWAKLTGEKLAEWSRNEGLPVYVFRPFSGYGSDQSLDYPFPSFIARAVAKRDPFHIWGDGTFIRDWIHIDDIVAAVFAVLETEKSVTTNLCTGRGYSFNDLAAMCAKVMEYSPDYTHLLDMPQGVVKRVGSPQRMYGYYRPQISLIDGIRRAIEEAGKK